MNKTITLALSVLLLTAGSSFALTAGPAGEDNAAYTAPRNLDQLTKPF